MVNKFTQKAQNSLNSARSFAKELGHSYIGTEHLLLGLLAEKESIASRILISRGASAKKLKKSIVDYMGIGTEGNITAEDMTPRLRNIIEVSAADASARGLRYVGTEHLLASLLNRKDCIGARLLEAEGIPCSELKADLSAYLSLTPQRPTELAGEAEADSKHKKNAYPTLSAYGKDLTALAASGRVDPVIDREEETERMIRILLRRSKNNPCLIGEPGVGKTAVVEGLALRISEGNVPEAMLNKKIITLDITSMIAGAKYRGEFEDRMKNAIAEASKDPDIILFVDEMHVLVGAGAAEGAIDAANILKPALARGEIRIIGATTVTEYRTHIEKDAALERRFQAVTLEEPSIARTERILFGLKEKYEAHHSLKIEDSAIKAAVALSVRYIPNRFLPDKAIDLLDEAAAKVKISKAAANKEAQLKNDKRRLSAEKAEAIEAGDLASAAEISSMEREIVLREDIEEQDGTASELKVTAEDVARIVTEWTGVPCSHVSASENDKLAHLEDILNERIIGQSEAVSAVANAIRRGRTGLSDRSRPTSSFLFLGSTGVGKTQLCRVLAEALFDTKSSLIKLDMSEYMEKHSVSKLIGAPPGYVGYGEGGMLTEKVRRSPYSVILFDEIEKAHPDVFDLLLQILEDGVLTDSSGRAADFSNTLLIMTSNLLAGDDISPRVLGFADAADIKDKAEGLSESQMKLLQNRFKPEFINRIDEIIIFHTLGEEELTRIASLMLNDLGARASGLGISLRVAPDVARILARKCLREHKDMGARPIRREIIKYIENPLSQYLLSDGEKSSTTVNITAKDEQIVFV